MEEESNEQLEIPRGVHFYFSFPRTGRLALSLSTISNPAINYEATAVSYVSLEYHLDLAAVYFISRQVTFADDFALPLLLNKKMSP